LIRNGGFDVAARDDATFLFFYSAKV